jgi:hypothetical protein
MKGLFAIILVLFLASFVPDVSVKKFAWLEGEWKLDGQGSYEVWQIHSDTLMAGGSFHQAGNDFVRDESIELKVENGQFYYIPIVYDGSKVPKPVRFVITSFTDTSFVAENQQHDFPQVIRYTLLSPKRMVATIFGPIKGKQKEIVFQYDKE